MWGEAPHKAVLEFRSRRFRRLFLRPKRVNLRGFPLRQVVSVPGNSRKPVSVQATDQDATKPQQTDI